MIDVATSVEGARATLERTDRNEDVYACLGVHPHEAAKPADLDELRRLLAHPKAVAVGETGLDYFRDYAPRDDQRRLFAAELELARDLRKPVVIHTRAATPCTRRRVTCWRQKYEPTNRAVASHPTQSIVTPRPPRPSPPIVAA